MPKLETKFNSDSKETLFSQASYRGTQRPTGNITNIYNDGDEQIVEAEFDGRTEKLSSSTLSAHKVWEFTEKGFKNVLAREEEKAARAEQPLSYRGAPSSNDELETKVARLESALKDMDLFKETCVATMKEIANEVHQMSVKNGLEAKFCGTLTKRYDALMESRSQPSLSKFDEKFQGVDDSDSCSDDD